MCEYVPIGTDILSTLCTRGDTASRPLTQYWDFRRITRLLHCCLRYSRRYTSDPRRKRRNRPAAPWNVNRPESSVNSASWYMNRPRNKRASRNDMGKAAALQLALHTNLSICSQIYITVWEALPRIALEFSSTDFMTVAKLGQQGRWAAASTHRNGNWLMLWTVHQ